MNRSYCLITTYTLCLNSAYLSKQISSYFETNNLAKKIESPHLADLIIINICSFIDTTEKESLDVITRLISKYPEKKIIICGCVPKLNTIQPSPNVLVIKSDQLSEFDRIFNPSICISDIKVGEVVHKSSELNYVNRGDYFIDICKGCANNCSYCAIKLAKGHVVSTPILHILDEIKVAIQQGYKRFTLLADDCGSYGLDMGSTLAELLNKIDEITEADIQFNLHYLYPAGLINLVASMNPSFFKKIYYMNVPIQSLSKKCLSLMNRKYSVQKVLSLINKIKKFNPSIFIGTHFIYCFPGETLKNFLKTFKLVRLFDEIEYFYFSPRIGTKAASIINPFSKKTFMNRSLIIKKKMKTHKEITLDVYSNILIDIEEDFKKNHPQNKRVIDLVIVHSDDPDKEIIPIESVKLADLYRTTKNIMILDQRFEDNASDLIRSMKETNPQLKILTRATIFHKILFVFRSLYLKARSRYLPYHLLIPYFAEYENLLREKGLLKKIKIKNGIPPRIEDYIARNLSI
ncbi:MAG: hypothetical protein A2Y40_09910 [Candidatus Margulisbacteria bacterium GWF2_35_9]|nr:MAG: hypothetical protein A2Y40_09910 [Candidatus Margulisbacteria bacterium GWF2_35_9]